MDPLTCSEQGTPGRWSVVPGTTYTSELVRAAAGNRSGIICYCKLFLLASEKIRQMHLNPECLNEMLECLFWLL